MGQPESKQQGPITDADYSPLSLSLSSPPTSPPSSNPAFYSPSPSLSSSSSSSFSPPPLTSSSSFISSPSPFYPNNNNFNNNIPNNNYSNTTNVATYIGPTNPNIGFLGPMFGGGPGAAEAIPYTNYSVEKTPEKNNNNNSNNNNNNNSKEKKNIAPTPQRTMIDDPIMETFKRSPSFVPILASKKLIYDDVDPRGIFNILKELDKYYRNQADFLQRDCSRVNDSIRQMEMACEKAASLTFQHVQQVQKFAASLSSVEQLSAQVVQTKQTIDKIFANIQLIETALDSRERSSSLSSPPLSSSLSSSFSSSPFPSPSPSPVIPREANANNINNNNNSESNNENNKNNFNNSPPGVIVHRPPRPKLKVRHESPYLTAKPRGAVSKNLSASDGVIPTASPPSSSPLEVWTLKIIPQWEELKVRETPWVRSMWKAGIPKEVRGHVWKLAIGNKLNLTPEIFAKLLEDSAESEEQNETNKAIELDVARTFAQLDVGDLTTFRGKLLRVLRAFSKLKSDLGYVQGMSYIAGILLQYLDDYESFVCMSNLLENSFLSGMFRLDAEAIDEYVSIFGSLLAQIEPKLDRHFAEIGLIPQHFLLQWWLPLFSKSLPLAVSGKIWDCFLLDGEIFVFVASLGILRMYRKELKTMDMEACKKLLGNLPTDIQEEDLFMAIESIPAPLYNSFLDKIHKLTPGSVAKD